MPPVQASVPEPGVAEVLGDATPGVAEELGRGEGRVVGSAEGVAPVGVGVAVGSPEGVGVAVGSAVGVGVGSTVGVGVDVGSTVGDGVGEGVALHDRPAGSTSAPVIETGTGPLVLEWSSGSIQVAVTVSGPS